MIRAAAFRSSKDDDGTVTLRFYHRDFPPAPARRRLGHDQTAHYPGVSFEQPREVGMLQVGFARPEESNAGVGGSVTGVALVWYEGLTPTDLQRFAWARWIRVADAIARDAHPRLGPGGFPEDPVTLAHLELKGIKVVPPAKRPGRRGHSPEFYEQIAAQYRSLVLQGERAPTNRIAKEGTYSRHTVAGWVRKARELGHLPPARRGRAG